MAALTRSARPSVRAAVPGEGRAVAALWRELWEAHEAWGGYPGSRDARVYAQLARRLDDDARVRAGHPVLGRHVHLIADLAGTPCGQVEGWFERHGDDPSTPFTCEVRSLVVAERARCRGAGRALLAALAETARSLAGGGPCLLAAEVLERNPARDFYTRVGFSPVTYNARIAASDGAQAAGPLLPSRPAVPGDAAVLGALETVLAARRRGEGDARFDGPRSLELGLIRAIAAHLAAVTDATLREPTPLVVLDESGAVRGSASVTAHTLEPPFLPLRRALIGRFALDESRPARALAAPLVSLGCRLAWSCGATHVELTDLSAPGSELHDAVLASGAVPWSRVVMRRV